MSDKMPPWRKPKQPEPVQGKGKATGKGKRKGKGTEKGARKGSWQWGKEGDRGVLRVFGQLAFGHAFDEVAFDLESLDDP